MLNILKLQYLWLQQVALQQPLSAPVGKSVWWLSRRSYKQSGCGYCRIDYNNDYTVIAANTISMYLLYLK